MVTEPEKSPDGMIVPADLTPVDAMPLRDSLLAVLDDAKDDASLDVNGDKLSMCALQLVVSTVRTAEKRGIKLHLSDRTEAALAGTDLR